MASSSPHPDRRRSIDASRLARADELVRRFVDEGTLPGAVTLVSRGGEIVHLATHGWCDIENRVPMSEDAIFRIYSMTKIVTTVAVLILYERGLLDLNDPAAKFLPAFADVKVKTADGALVPPRRAIRVYDLLRHCAGLQPPPPIDELMTCGHDLAGLCDHWATLPLVENPDERWSYGVSTDVLARVVEVISGLRFDSFLQKEIFEPLGMRDTGFRVTDKDAGRLCVCYRHDREGKLTRLDDNTRASRYRGEPKLLSGGAGLVSTTLDYHRFAAMLLGGGSLGGVKILGRKTVELMSMDHLPKAHPNLEIGTQCFRFGLGVSVVTDVAASRCLSSLGDYGWGGAAGTQVWINPEEDMVVMIMIQVRADVPTGIMDIYKRLVYQALD